MSMMYSKGCKFCSRCRAFLFIDGNRCPKCGALVRSRPRKKLHNTSKPEIAVSPEILEEAAEVDVMVKIHGVLIPYRLLEAKMAGKEQRQIQA